MDWIDWWIAENAYYQWMDAGCPDNRSDEFWFNAERAFRAWLEAQGQKDTSQRDSNGTA